MQPAISSAERPNLVVALRLNLEVPFRGIWPPVSNGSERAGPLFVRRGAFRKGGATALTLLAEARRARFRKAPRGFWSLKVLCEPSGRPGARPLVFQLRPRVVAA